MNESHANFFYPKCTTNLKQQIQVLLEINKKLKKDNERLSAAVNNLSEILVANQEKKHK